MRWAMGGGRGGIFHFWGVSGSTGGRYRAGRAVPITCRVVFGAVGATCGGGDATVKDWFEISTPGAGWIGAAMLCLGMGASTEGAYGRVLAARFDRTESPAVIALLGGGRRVGSLDNIVATKDRDSGEVGLVFPVFCRDLNHDREGFLVVEAGGSIWVEEAGFGDKDRLRVKNGGLKEVTQGSVGLRVSRDGQAMDGKL